MKLDKIKEISLALAPKHPSDQRCRHFSFIINKKKIISIGFNNPKTHPLNLKHNFVNKYDHCIRQVVGTHSELNALLKLGYRDDYSDLVLINTRVNRRNEIDFSMPCNGCKSMLEGMNFKKVFYTSRDGSFVRFL